jgi:general secretion pathway protein H
MMISATGTWKSKTEVDPLLQASIHQEDQQMRALAKQHAVSRNSRGFTLLEIIVVVVIIGLVLTIAIPRLYRHNPESILEQEARRLARKIELAGQEAMLKSSQLGLQIKENTYRFLRFEENKWVQPYEEILNQYKLKNEISMDLALEGIPIKIGTEQKKDAPQILILSSGEYSPFEIIFRNRSKTESYISLSVNQVGEISIQQRR